MTTWLPDALLGAPLLPTLFLWVRCVFLLCVDCFDFSLDFVISHCDIGFVYSVVHIPIIIYGLGRNSRYLYRKAQPVPSRDSHDWMVTITKATASCNRLYWHAIFAIGETHVIGYQESACLVSEYHRKLGCYRLFRCFSRFYSIHIIIFIGCSKYQFLYQMFNQRNPKCGFNQEVDLIF